MPSQEPRHASSCIGHLLGYVKYGVHIGRLLSLHSDMGQSDGGDAAQAYMYSTVRGTQSIMLVEFLSITMGPVSMNPSLGIGSSDAS